MAATVSRGLIRYQALGKELCMFSLIFSSQLPEELDTPISSFWRQGNEELETLRNLPKDTQLLGGLAGAQIQLQCWIISDLSVWVLLVFVSCVTVASSTISKPCSVFTVDGREEPLFLQSEFQWGRVFSKHISCFLSLLYLFLGRWGTALFGKFENTWLCSTQHCPFPWEGAAPGALPPVSSGGCPGPCSLVLGFTISDALQLPVLNASSPTWFIITSKGDLYWLLSVPFHFMSQLVQNAGKANGMPFTQSPLESPKGAS